MRTALFWVITQRVVVISYLGFLTPEDGTDRLSRNFGKKLPLVAAYITQKCSVLIYFPAEAKNQAYKHHFPYKFPYRYLVDSVNALFSVNSAKYCVITSPFTVLESQWFY